MSINQLKGVSCSSGIGIAKAFCLIKPKWELSKFDNNWNQDLAKKAWNDSIEITTKQLEQIKAITLQKIGAEKAEIFEAHIGIVNDPEINNEIINKINNSFTYLNLIKIIENVFSKYYEIFKNMDDPYFKERAIDVLDVKTRLIANILKIDLPDLLNINEDVIIVCDELTPSDTVLLNKKYVKGIIAETGGRTSHAAIMARSLEIPAVLGAKNALNQIKPNQLIAINGEKGIIDLNPDKNLWLNLIENYRKEQIELSKYAKLKTKTIDGHIVHIEANIGNPKDGKQALIYGCEGVGLYRSEFLYMSNDHWPTEEEQFEGYKAVLEQMPDELVVIRTLDIGGDKKLSYFTFNEEMNPFLGFRAIRFCLEHKDIFKTQLRALARASIYGKLGIMFPMIATIEEFMETKQFALNVFKELENEGIKIAKNILLGMMVEIPSTAILSNEFSKYADFFSIGTNDLIQYTFACDRMNKQISYLYQPNNPSLLKMVDLTIKGGHLNNKWVAMCGEMAGDILSIPLLLGMGLDRFSMSATSIPKARKIINNLSFDECQELANKALLLKTSDEVNNLVKEFLIKKNLINE